jgi:hypothetical protein
VYPEGRPVSVRVRRPADLAQVEELIAVKLGPGTRSGTSAAAARSGRRKE